MVLRTSVVVVGRDPVYSPSGAVIDWVETGRHENAVDLETNQFALFVLACVFQTSETIQDSTNTGRSISAGATLATFRIQADTGTTPAAAVTDYTTTGGHFNTANYFVAATIGSQSGSGTSGSFTVTGTITNSSGSSITYGEVGISAATGGNTFLLCHDILASTIAVSNNGTLQVTYTITNQ